MTNQVAAVAAADLPDARRLMWALGHQAETGNSFSVAMSDGATVTYFYHSWHNLLPATATTMYFVAGAGTVGGFASFGSVSVRKVL